MVEEGLPADSESPSGGAAVSAVPVESRLEELAPEPGHCLHPGPRGRRRRPGPREERGIHRAAPGLDHGHLNHVTQLADVPGPGVGEQGLLRGPAPPRRREAVPRRRQLGKEVAQDRDVLAPLAKRAQEVYARLEITNVLQRVGDGSLGWKTYAPYDGIIVTAAAPRVPPSLLEQLADGGRLVVPTGSRGGQILSIITREGDRFHERTDVPCVFVPLVGEEGWKRD